MFGGSVLAAIAVPPALLLPAVQQADVDHLPQQIQQVLASEFDEFRAQENVVMNVINTESEVGKPDFGGVRLKLHPAWMGRGLRDTRFRHVLGYSIGQIFTVA